MTIEVNYDGMRAPASKRREGNQVRIHDFWRSAWADNNLGFRFVVGMCIFWFAPLMFGAMAIMGQGTVWRILGWAAVTAVGWVGAWVVMLTRRFRSEPGTLVDLTPTKPMLIPAALMVGGVVGCLLSF
ncbi:hypothetical protein N802_01845 [Knoellia sinensis KCTC 19936]|uniref:Uncharacterized protein n=1 Tax=Knoellia sinensis KCTC 19936 TaxID=1385520 RepID=A0A0A0JCF0_9MICO|nr:hypothetical protein [Knoellia sinensis]KGN35035.1 hypothetical protein N802_01845 [Knoellia sinensis KCTC 19936]